MSNGSSSRGVITVTSKVESSVNFQFGGPLTRNSPKSTGRITGPSSVTPPTMFGHVYPPSIWIRFYPRKSLGHDALNEYLRCARTVRGILRRPSDEMFRSIITAGACAEYPGAAGYGKDDNHDTKTATPGIMPFRWLLDEREGPFLRITRRFSRR